MTEFVETLEIELRRGSDATIALEQRAYMRDKFEFYGITAIRRREIQKPFFIKSHLPEKRELHSIVKELWSKPERECQYFAQELVFKYYKQLEEKDIELFEYMIINKSWWDTVDFISNKLVGEYFKKYPEQVGKYVEKWLESNNIWLQRSALLFQLKYRDNLNPELLSFIIHGLLNSKEFFINKAIGWVLREYSRTNPIWVADFVNNTELNALSKKEALRLIK